MYREHKLRIMRYSLKNLWMLIFPLLRGVSVIRFDPAGIYAWIKGAWMDIAVLGIILVYGFIRWYCAKITVSDEAVTMEEGLFIRIKRRIPFGSISLISTERAFWLVPLKAVILKCETRAGIFSSTDLTIMVDERVGREILSHIPDIDRQKAQEDIPKPTLRSVMLFSVFFSSGFSGAVYIAAFFFKGGDIARDLIELSLDRITETTELIYSRLLTGIPKAAAVAGLFFLSAWVLSFLMNLSRYARFDISADDRQFEVVCGFFKRRRYRIRTAHINYIDLRQNLIMKLSGAVTVNISCPGYGNSSYLPVLMPFGKETELGLGLGMNAVPLKKAPQYRPKKGSIMSYIGVPAAFTVILPLLYGLSERFFPQFGQLTLFLLIMAEIPFAWLTAVKTVALKTTGVSVYGDKTVIRSSKWTSFHTAVVSNENVMLVRLRQHILQKPFGKCDLIFWLAGESTSKYTVKALPVEDGGHILNTFVK